MSTSAKTLRNLLVGLLLCGDLLAAGLDASLDRTRVVEGEALVLTLTAPGDAWGVPDLSPLEADFEVTNQGQSTRMSIVNGRSSSVREWQFMLAPKRSGALSVPSLVLGNLSSEPLAVEVLPADRAAEVGESLPVMLEVEVDQESPYVQGQVIYRALVLSSVSVSQGSLTDPVSEGSIIERLGEDRRFETYRNGRRYQVIERSYAVFPQRSGPVKIQAPVLTGEVPEQRASRKTPRGSMFGGALGQDFERFFGRDPFEDMGGLFQSTRPVRVSGRELELAVRPQPAGTGSPWLPAESLQLVETWSPDISELRVGEPVTRTIAITAQGLTDAQLPDLEIPLPDGVRAYPDKTRAETRADGDDLVSVKEIKLALVASAEGELTLPEVRLSWWDTEADRERVAALPARVVNVLPARAGAPAAPAQFAAEPSLAQAESGRPAHKTPEAPAGIQDAAPPSERPAPIDWPFPAGLWPWISGGLVVVWLLTLGLWLRERRASRQRGEPKGGKPPGSAQGTSLSHLRSGIKRACVAGDPRAAREALLAWAAVNWPDAPPRRLEDLARRLDAGAGDALEELDRCLYAGAAARWDGARAWSALEPMLSRASRGSGDRAAAADALPPLYPRGA